MIVAGFLNKDQMIQKVITKFCWDHSIYCKKMILAWVPERTVRRKTILFGPLILTGASQKRSHDPRRCEMILPGISYLQKSTILVRVLPNKVRWCHFGPMNLGYFLGVWRDLLKRPSRQRSTCCPVNPTTGLPFGCDFFQYQPVLSKSASWPHKIFDDKMET